MLKVKKKTQQPNAWTNLCSSVVKFALPATVITYLVIKCYEKCYAETNTDATDVSSSDLALVGQLMCPLYAIAAIVGLEQQKVVTYDPKERDNCLNTFPVNQSDPDSGETCISTTKNFPLSDHIFHAQTIEDINRAKSGWWGIEIDARMGDYQSTFAHFQIINHWYDNFLNVYKDLSLGDIAKISIAQDINGRTPFHISISIAAPGEVQRALMTKENVMMPDNNGVTPLMLAAAGFSNAQTTKHLLCLIGEDRLAEALPARDKNGRSVEDYSKMSKKEIIAYLQALEIDSNKASDSCHNSFMVDVYGPICALKTDVQEAMAREFTMGRTFIGKTPYQCVVATQSNIQKIKKLATGESAEYQKMRDAITNDLYAEAPSHIKKGMWAGYKKTAENIHLSENSLIQSIMNRKKSNAHLFRKG